MLQVLRGVSRNFEILTDGTISNIESLYYVSPKCWVNSTGKFDTKYEL